MHPRRYSQRDRKKDEDVLVREDSSLKDILNNFAAITTAHGIPRIINRPNWLSKLFWFVLVTAACALFYLQTYQHLSNYYAHNTRIELIHSEDIDFPAVTVCNMNKVKRSLLGRNDRWKFLLSLDGDWKEEDFVYYEWFWQDFTFETYSYNAGIQQEVLDYKQDTSTEETGWDSSTGYASEGLSWRKKRQVYPFYESLGFDDEGTSEQELSSLPDNFLYVVSSRLNMTKEELRDMGHKAEDFILQCSFNARLCNHTYFETFQNNIYGNCFTFKGNAEENHSWKVSKAGADHGLHLTMFIEQPEYVGILTEESGVRIAIHPPHTYPHPEDVGFSLSPGMSTSVGLQQVELTRLKEPYGDCTDGSDRKYIHSSLFNYSILSCQKRCLHDRVVMKCKCTNGIYDDYDGYRVCNYNDRQCYKPVEDAFHENNLGCNCPAPCREIVYNTQITSSLWPSERYQAHLRKKLYDANKTAAHLLDNVEMARKNLVRVKIYFQELNYELVQQVKANTIESVLGTIGGLMGLFIGFSVITIGEIIVLIYDIIALILRRALQAGRK